MDTSARPEAHEQDEARDGEEPRSRKRTWLLGCSTVLVLLLLPPAWQLYRSARPAASIQQELRKRIARAEADGLAVTLPTFRHKYPASSEGAAAVEEAARITEDFDWSSYSTASSLPSSPTATTGTITRFDLQRLLGRNIGVGRGTFTEAALEPYIRSNSAALEALVNLARTLPHEGPGWEASFTSLSPFNQLQKTLKAKRDPGGYFLRLRETSRVLLPAAVHKALRDGDPHRAYGIVLGSAGMTRALKASGTSLVDAMIGLALDDLWMETAGELIRTTPPPDRETAWRLYECLDPDRIRADYLRGCEAEVIFWNELLLNMVGDTPAPPANHVGVPEQMKRDALEGFRKQVDNFMGVLADGRLPSSLPKLSSLKLAYPGLGRADIYQATVLNVEWLTRAKALSEVSSMKEADRVLADINRWISVGWDGNPFAAMSVPAFVRSTMGMHAARAKASVLRAALLLRVAELESTGTLTAVPSSLEEVCRQLSRPVPLDPLADDPNTPVEYEPHPENGTYVIRHKPGRRPYAGSPPEEFRGEWKGAER